VGDHDGGRSSERTDHPEQEFQQQERYWFVQQKKQEGEKPYHKSKAPSSTPIAARP